MSDTLFALWIAVSAVLLVLFAYAVILNLRNRQGRPVAPDELIPSLKPVNIDDFAGLVASLDAPQGVRREDLNRVQGEPRQQITRSLRHMAHNAALLQRLGYAQLNSGNELISDLAQQMIDAGVHVRLYTFVALAALHLRNAFQVAGINIIPAGRLLELKEMISSSLLPAYQQMKENAGHMTFLKFSAVHEALSGSL